MGQGLGGVEGAGGLKTKMKIILYQISLFLSFFIVSDRLSVV